MQKRSALNGLLIMGLAFGAAANADDAPGFYAGASLGEASVEVDDVDFDGSDTSFKVFGGYSFNQHFALELAYFDGGNADERIGAGVVGVELSGLNASAVGRLPVGENFSLFGKVGFASYDAEVTARVNGQTLFAEDGSDEDLSYGVGGEFRFGPSFGLRAEYEMVDASGAEFTLMSIGGSFRF
jgi:OmpA-OmpF porin, OOP family